MTKHIELKRFNQGTALTTGTFALPPLVIEGLAEFNGSFERLCLKAGTAAIEVMLAADAEQFCGKPAFNQVLIGVATRKYARLIRFPDGDLAGQAMRATTKSSVSRRF